MFKDVSSTFPSTTPAATPPGSIFGDTKASAVSTPEKASIGEKHVAPDPATTAEKQAQDVPVSAQEQVFSHANQHVEQPAPPLAVPDNSAPVNAPSAPPEPEEPALVTEDFSAMAPAEELAADGELSIGKSSLF